MTHDLEQHGLFKLSPAVRAKALAGMGVSEAEYRAKLNAQLERETRHAAAEAKGEIVHGWSTKQPNPGWSDDKIVGEVIPAPTSFEYSDAVLKFLDDSKREGDSSPRMLTPSELELSRQHTKESSSIIRTKLKAMGVKPDQR